MSDLGYEAFEKINNYANSCTHKQVIYATVNSLTSPDIIKKYLNYDKFEGLYIVVFIKEKINIYFGKAGNHGYYKGDIKLLDPVEYNLSSPNVRESIQNTLFNNLIYDIVYGRENTTDKLKYVLSTFKIPKQKLNKALGYIIIMEMMDGVKMIQ